MNMKKETTVAEKAAKDPSALKALNVEDNGRCDSDLDSPENAVDLASKKKYPDDPLDVVTGKFTPERILYSKDTFVVAQGTWKDKGRAVENSYACRWHDPDRVGYPNGFGRPQWFLLPAKDAGFITSESLETAFTLILED